MQLLIFLYLFPNLIFDKVKTLSSRDAYHRHQLKYNIGNIPLIPLIESYR